MVFVDEFREPNKEQTVVILALDFQLLPRFFESGSELLLSVRQVLAKDAS